MALEATHIRIAVDLKDKYNVSDLNRYIAGTIYPDSRYVTKIQRKLTHSADFLNWDLKTVQDFKKGWLVHLLADKVQAKVIMEKLPELAKEKIVHGSDVWIAHTAIKILRDLDDIKNFDIVPYLKCLDYIEAPNGEDPALIEKYNQSFKTMYRNPNEITVESYTKMWQEFGIGEELLKAVIDKTKTFLNNQKIMATVSKIYPEIIARLNSK